MDSRNVSKYEWSKVTKRMLLEGEGVERKVFTNIREDELRKDYNDMARTTAETYKATVIKMDQFKVAFLDLIDKLKQSKDRNPHHRFKVQLENFENKLTSFKLNMRTEYDEMEKKEQFLYKEIEACEATFNSWADTINDDKQAEIDRNQKILQEKKNDERYQKDLERKAAVGSIDKKIILLGKDGGWDSRDHDAFIRVWNQYIEPEDIMLGSKPPSPQKPEEGTNPMRKKNSFRSPPKSPGTIPTPKLHISSQQKTQIIKKCSSLVPGKRDDDFEEHIKWYLNYIYLTTKKREIIAEWKKETLSAKNQDNKQALKSEVLSRNESLSAIHFNEKMNISANNEINEKELHIVEEERQAAKHRIAKWRHDKAKQLELEKEEELRNASYEKKEVDEAKKKRQAMIKAQLEKWKRTERLSKELMLETENHINNQFKMTDTDLRQRQMRDLEIAKKKHEKIDQSNKKLSERERRIREANVSVLSHPVTRDPNRLYHHTKASENSAIMAGDLAIASQRRASSGAHVAMVAMNARDLNVLGTSRGTPTWMGQNRHHLT